MALQEPARRSALTGSQLRAIRVWCRHRADQKIARAHAMEPYWLDRKPHAETRYQLGMTVNEYRDARRWLDAAGDQVKAKPGWTVYEALHEIADHHIDCVLKFGVLRDGGGTLEEIRRRLGLSERDFGFVRDWWRDAFTAVGQHADDD